MASETKKKRASGHLTQAADVLQALLQNSKSSLSDGFTRWKLEQSWPDIVGETIAKQTLPASYDKGTLFIWVRHPTWMQQLWFFQDSIRDKVNTHIGGQWVLQVKFTTNKRAAVSAEREA